jgi:iron complex outermembrane recepter protein
MTSKYVPGMISQHNAGLASANAYYLRGLGNSQSTATFDAPVTTYVDDIYIARQNANNYAFFDTERVEVLRGPQGTLFGRNTTGGAINVILRKPRPDPTLTMEATAGSYDRYTFKASADVPLTDQILTKISAYEIYDRGYLKNITTGQRLNGEQNHGIRGDVRFLPTERLTIDLSAEYTSNRATYQAVRSIPSATPNPYLRGTAAARTSLVFYETAAGLPNGRCSGDNVNMLLNEGNGSCSLSESVAVNANVALEIGTGTLNYIAGYRKLTQGYITQYDANTANKFAGFIIADNGVNEQYSQELKYNGDALSDRLHFVAGLFYFHEKTNDRQTSFSGGTTAFRVIQDQHLLPKVETAAVYGQADFNLTDQLTLTAGGRYTYEKKTVDYRLSTQFPGFGYTGAQVAAFGIPLKQVEKRFTPRVAVSYKLNPDALLFLSATNGFKSGGWNGGAAAPQNAVVFDPEVTWSYEGGLKSELFNRRVRLNVAGYFARTKDLQVTAGVVSPITGQIASLPFNAGTLEVYGVEVESSFAISRDFSVFANPSYMHGEYTYIVPTTTVLTTGTVPVRVPKFQFSGGATYMTPVAALGGSIGGSAAYRHNSPYFVAVLNTAKTKTENFVDAAINYKTDDEKWALSFEVSNLTKQKTVTANFLSLFAGDPRRFTGRVKLKL